MDDATRQSPPAYESGLAKKESVRRQLRTAVLVAGMHRSGTSALARVLSLLGCDLPRTLMGPGQGNESGHWESNLITGVNDDILASIGSSWDDWLPVDPAWYSSPKAEEFRERALDGLAHEFGPSGLFVLKDPRICRLLPFWLTVLERANIRPAIILCMRNPLETAASLQARDGIDSSVGRLIWLRHVLDAEAASRTMRRFVCSYDQLLGSWSQIMRRAEAALDMRWPRFGVRAEQEIDEFLAIRHRHHRETRESLIDNVTQAAWLRDSFEVLDRWSESGENAADYVALDRIREAFNVAGPAFARPVISGQLAQRRERALEQGLAQARRDRDAAVAANSSLAEIAAARDAALEELRQIRARVDELEARSSTEALVWSAELQTARRALEEQRTVVTALAKERDAALAERQAVERAQTEQGATLGQIRESLDAAAAELKAMQRTRAEQRAFLAEVAKERDSLAAKLAATTAELRASQDKAARLGEELRASQEQAARFGEQLRASQDRAARLEEELRTNRDEAARLRQELEVAKTAEVRLAETQERLNERFVELAALSKLLREQEDGTRLATEKAEWLRRVAATLLAGGESWRGRLFQLLPGFVIRAWVLGHVQRQGLFDARAYLRVNADVAKAGTDPLRHYIHHGMREGRDRGGLDPG